jgi:hypothetical protein
MLTDMDMGDVLDGLTQPLTLIEVVQEVVDYKPVNVENITEIQAVVQVADPSKIKSDKVDFSKRYLQVHTKNTLKNIDMCIYQGFRYKAFLLKPYNNYGFDEAYFEETKSA